MSSYPLIQLNALGSMRQIQDTYKKLTSEFHYLPRVGPKQLTHLECTRAADTSLVQYLISKLSLVGKGRASFLDYFNPSKITLISIHILQIIQALYVT